MAQPDSSLSRKIHLFGPLRIQDSQGLRALNGEKAQNLLAYLALRPGAPHSRERLADVLFPDAAPARMRRNVSDTLYRLQKTLDNDWLLLEGETISLRISDDLLVDVWEFDRLTASPAPADWQKAIEYYTGDLLPECYQDWILPERELRRNQFLFTLENLAAHQEANGHLQQALLTIRRLILTEPLHEAAHQTYLRLLGRLQRYGEAQAHYQYLRHLLDQELGAQPLAETQNILQTLEQERAVAAVPLSSQDHLPFVGRRAERAAILAAVEASLQGKGGVIAIEGEAGMGKSRLLREISASARWRGATVLEGVTSEIPEASPFAPLVTALAGYLSQRTAQFEALLAPNLLAALAPLFPPWQKYTAQPQEAEQAQRFFEHAVRTLGETLASLSPMVLILDDLHWASAGLWSCLQLLAQSLVQHGGLLIITYRRADIEKRAGWEYLQTWERMGRLTIIPLPPLTMEEVALLLEDKSPPEIAFAHALTGGNPFLLGEWMVERDDQPRANPILRRLTSTLPLARTALEYAAVLGETVSFPLWVNMLEMAPLTLATLSDELVTARWLTPSPTGFTFTHDLIRTAIYAELDPARRRALHLRAARAYQTLEAENARSFAFHLDCAGQAQEAALAYRRAGEQNRRWFAYREAQAALSRALELLPSTLTTQRLETALELAEVCEATAAREVQRRVLQEVLEGAGDDRQLIRACLIQGRAFSTMNQFAEADAMFQKVIELAIRLKDRLYEARALTSLGLNANRQYQTDKAQNYYKRALKLARKLSSRALEGQCLSGLGISAIDLGAPDVGARWLEQALAIQREIGDYLGEYRTRTYLISANYHLGAWDQLLMLADEVIPHFEQMGNRHMLAYLRMLRGLAFYSLGDTDNAHRLLAQAEQDYQAVNDFQAAGLTHNTLGLVAENDGRFEDAQQFYQTALTRAETLEAINETNLAQIDLGTLLLHLSQPEQAIPLLETAYQTSTEHQFKMMTAKSEAVLGLAYLQMGDARAAQLASNGWKRFQAGIPLGEQPQSWLWALYQLLSAKNSLAQAEEVLRAAYRELQRQARAISDHALRRSFFERVSLNRKIVKAYDTLTQTARHLPVSLAQREAPLGRTLRDDELVQVQWTILAPEDEAISDKTAQRQYRLKRLLAEAEARGAAPTDDDLAHALNVSRRTILRDMQTLSAELPRLPTRKRK
jgi:DNA-binding SARP family transcriptional activator/tetratricopeptide (TPR) repeat protein